MHINKKSIQSKKYCNWKDDNLMLELYVCPKASKNAIVGLHGNRLKITITTPPIEGKANEKLIRFLAKSFGVAQNQMNIVKGQNSKYKSILILNPRNKIILPFIE